MATGAHRIRKIFIRPTDTTSNVPEVGPRCPFALSRLRERAGVRSGARRGWRGGGRRRWGAGGAWWRRRRGLPALANGLAALAPGRPPAGRAPGPRACLDCSGVARSIRRSPGRDSGQGTARAGRLAGGGLGGRRCVLSAPAAVVVSAAAARAGRPRRGLRGGRGRGLPFRRWSGGVGGGLAGRWRAGRSPPRAETIAAGRIAGGPHGGARALPPRRRSNTRA